MLYQFLIYAISTSIMLFSTINPLHFKIPPKQTVTCFFAMLTITYIFQPFLGQAISIVWIITLLFYLFCTHNHRLLTLAGFCLGYSICILIDYLLSLFCLYILLFSYDTIYNEYYIYFAITELLFSYLITYHLGKFLRKHMYPKFPSIPRHVMLTIVAPLTLSLAMFIFNFVVGDRVGYSKDTLTFNGILIIIYFIFAVIIIWNIIRSMQKQLHAEHMQESYQNLEEYTKRLEQAHIDLRTFKHDYINLISGIYGYVENSDIDGLRLFMHSEILPLSAELRSIDSQLSVLSNIRLPELKSVLSSKIIYGQNHGIAIHLDMEEPITRLPMKTADFIRIAGIYLNNALESAIEVKEQDGLAKIEIAFILMEESVIFLVRNSVAPSIHINMNMIYESGYSTKGANRGLGLASVQKILSCYDNAVRNTSLQDGMFVQMLELFYGGVKE